MSEIKNTGLENWSYPVIGKGSKVGVHGIWASDVPNYNATLVKSGAKFPVVKAVDDLSWLAPIKASSPQTIILGRFTSEYEGCGGVADPATDLDTMANQIMDVILKKLDADPDLRDVVDHWEPVNEPDPPGVEGYHRLSLLMMKCMERADAEGLKLAIFALSAGTPEWDEMVAMVETGAFGYAKQGGHILALHEGVFGDDPIDKWWGDQIPGSPVVEGAGALCFRYRYIYHLLQQRDEVIPLVISEIRFNGGFEHNVLPLQEIVNRARWYDEKASKDYWLWAFCPFTVGGTQVGWGHHDYGYAYPALVDYMISVKDQQNALPSGSHAEESERALKNGSFEEDWTDMPTAAGDLINQQPNGWTLRWVEPGESLFGVSDKAQGVPECIHKLSSQLSPTERLGGPEALILDGNVTYQISHDSLPFGAELRQVVTGLKPGSEGKLTVPILANLHGDADIWGTESGVWVNDKGEWVNADIMGHRRWFKHQVQFTVPDNGEIEIVIRCKNKWPLPKDFFIDGVRLEATAADEGDRDVIKISTPSGWKVRATAVDDLDKILVVVPTGTHVEVMES